MIDYKVLLALFGFSGYVSFSSCNDIQSGGSASELRDTMKQMDQAGNAYKKHLEQETLAFMSLETMFPDERVRALAKAAAQGNIKKIDSLVAEGVEVNSAGTRGATPLYWALRNYKGAERLLELGANPDLVYEDGATILCKAVQLKDIRVMRVLLEHGANPNVKESTNMADAPIHYAINCGMDRVDLLLTHGADINMVDGVGFTPLIGACALGRYEIAYQLLQRGSDYTIRDRNGFSIADYIRTSQLMQNTKYYARMVKVAEYLRAKGVDVVLPHEVNDNGASE